MSDSNTEKDKGLVVVALLNFFQAIGRLIFAPLGIQGGIDQFLDVPVSDTTSLILHIMFFFLGITGLAAAYGLWKNLKWGIRAVIFVSVLTIIFDIWGFTIQKTAAIGFFVPLVSLAYLYFKRSQRVE